MRARRFASLGCRIVLAVASTGIFSGVHATEGVASWTVVDTAGDAAAVPAHTLGPLRTAAASGAGRIASGAQLVAASSAVDVGSAALAGVPAAAAADAEMPEPRSKSDYLLLIIVGLALVAYQLLRKHRLLRPQPFSL